MDDKIRLREYPKAKLKEKRSDDAEAHHTLSSIVVFFYSSNLTIPTLFKSEFISDIIIIPSPPFLSSPLYPPIPSSFLHYPVLFSPIFYPLLSPLLLNPLREVLQTLLRTRIVDSEDGTSRYNVAVQSPFLSCPKELLLLSDYGTLQPIPTSWPGPGIGTGQGAGSGITGE